MRKIGKTGAIVLCLALFSAFALGSGSSGSSTSTSESTKEETSAVTSQTETSSETTESVTATDTSSEDTKTEFYVGETFEDKGLSITYVSSGDYESDNEFITPADGNKFIRLYFHVDNQSSSDQSISTYSFHCYADGYECSATYMEDDISASLSTGRSTDGAVYFEVPVDAAEVEVEYEYNLFSDKKIKFIYEGDKDSGLTFEKNITESADALHVGDTLETKNLKISYLNAAEYVSDNMFIQPADGMKYIYIELEFENLSSTDQSISYFSFECYADGASCSGYYGMDDLLSATLSSGRKAKGTVAFEVPADASVIEIEFEDNIWTDNKIIFSYN